MRSGWSDRARGTRHERGYGNAWDRLRLLILRRDGYICQCPKCKGGLLRLRNAHEVDHVKPKAQGGGDSPDNLRAVNRECHRRITAEQRGRTIRPVVMTGIDGYPIEQRATRSNE